MGILKLLSGLADWANAYVGEKAELVVDESNWDLRLHDDGTVGGHIIQNRDNADARYQLKNPEFEGVEFEVTEKGFLIRRGAGDYMIRSLAVIGDLVITNPTGELGNPSINLKPIMEGVYTWTGAQTFSGGINGDLTGDSFGTHTGPSTGLHTGNVLGNLQGDSEGNHLGGIDVRGSEVYFDVGQIPAEAVGGLNIPTEIPTGSIILWSGAANAIPVGWLLCDGTNGTPDLRNRFIVGAGDTYAVGAAAGTTEHTHIGELEAAGEHTHTGTVEDHILTEAQIPSHRHSSGFCDTSANAMNHGSIPANPMSPSSVDNKSDDGTLEALSAYTGGGQAHSHGLTIDAAGNHVHPVAIQNQAHLPPYYALCYIMRGA